MEAEWSVAAGADDPVIEVPWSDAAGGAVWVDLRLAAARQSEFVAALPEAANSPAMAWALTQMNVPGGRWLTAKCDRWLLSQAEREELADALGSPAQACGIASYIDVLLSSPAAMANFLLHEEWARVTARRCASMDVGCARMELIVRAAVCNDAWGYGMTMYCYGGGPDEQRAEQIWSEALGKTTLALLASAEALFDGVG